MSLYWFPDNTVLCNFAAVSSLHLLEEILRGRGRWVEAIAWEAQRSVREYPDLAAIARDGWLDAPITIVNLAEIEQIERIRRAAFGGSAQEPLKHLGEAQTCCVILHRESFAGSFWITDDRDALEYAQARGITTRDTMDLISEAIADGVCTHDEGFKLLHLMRYVGRHLRVPDRPSQL